MATVVARTTSAANGISTATGTSGNVAPTVGASIVPPFCFTNHACDVANPPPVLVGSPGKAYMTAPVVGSIVADEKSARLRLPLPLSPSSGVPQKMPVVQMLP